MKAQVDIKQHRKLDVINGLRGYAIVAVLYYHLFASITVFDFVTFDLSGISISLFPFTILSNTWLGVNLFFILSGFVLYLPYAQGERAFRSAHDLLHFYRRRALRLLPLYYLNVVIAFIMFGLTKKFGMQNIFSDICLMATATFTFTKSLWAPKYNWVLWSLGIEIWFSILFPFLVLAIDKYGMKKIIVFVFLLSLAVRIVGNAFEYFDVGSIYVNVLKDSLFGRLDDFLTGMFLCTVLARNDRFQTGRWNPKILFAAGILLIVLASTCWDYIAFKLASKHIAPFINNILQAGFSCLVLALLSMRVGFLRTLFDNRLIQMIGMMCFSLYIWHGMVIKLVNFLVGRPIPFYLWAACCLAVLICVALLTYRYVEFGHIKDGKRLFVPA